MEKILHHYPIKILLALILSNLLIFSSPGWSADFAKGYAAAQSGDFETAFREWVPLAEQGDVNAQLNLALMYYNGEGVPQDDKTAVKWYTLAAEQGYAKAQS